MRCQIMLLMHTSLLLAVHWCWPGEGDSHVEGHTIKLPIINNANVLWNVGGGGGFSRLCLNQTRHASSISEYDTWTAFVLKISWRRSLMCIFALDKCYCFSGGARQLQIYCADAWTAKVLLMWSTDSEKNSVSRLQYQIVSWSLREYSSDRNKVSSDPESWDSKNSGDDCRNPLPLCR